MRAYLIDEGILLTEEDEEFESYATVYNKKYGYYDEGQYYVKDEQRAIEDYKEVLNKTDNANLKQIIVRILEDEYVHLEYFNNVLDLIKN